MNKLNYASLPASKKLVDNGILVREVKVWDRVHHITGKEGVVIQFDPLPVVCCKDGSMFRCDPRTLTILYSFTEVWRELPEEIKHEERRAELYMLKMDGETICGYAIYDEAIHLEQNTNPTDALIELLIWVRKEKK